MEGPHAVATNPSIVHEYVPILHFDQLALRHWSAETIQYEHALSMTHICTFNRCLGFALSRFHNIGLGNTGRAGNHTVAVDVSSAITRRFKFLAKLQDTVSEVRRKLSRALGLTEGKAARALQSHTSLA